MARSFEDIAAAYGWTAETQVEILLDYMRMTDQLNDIDNHAEIVAAEDYTADATEGEPLPDICPACQIAGSHPVVPRHSADAYCSYCGADWPTEDDEPEECAPLCASRVPGGECTCGRIDRIAAAEDGRG